jgi:predicted ATPase/DNA-binding SARP family transcriptional activator
MAGAIQYEVLGRLTVHRADDPGTDISPRGALQRRLLCALVLRANEVVHADALADVVWPGGLPANHLAALQTHVFRLRQLLPAGSIDSEPAGYRLRAAPDDSDAQRFESGIYEAARVRVEDPGAAVARLDEMLGWWRGTPYEEVADLDDARIEAARLGELRVRAAEERSACLLDLGQHAALVVDLEALAAHHPLRERLQAQLMLALHRSGRRADALAVFERYRRALGEELGIEPSAALQQLHDDIVTGDIDERAPAPPAGGTTVAAPPSPPAGALSRSPLRPNALNEVVRYASTFVGREALVAKVAGLLERERLVTLVGTGGVGKTRAAAEVCAAVEGRFAGVLWFCELAAADASSVTLTVAAALGIDERGGVDHLVRIAEVLRAQGGLLVLDNCEHVIDEAAEMAETILSGAPDVRILATSRERLAVDGEHLLVVDPLPPPERADPGGPAVQLFVDRARAVRPEWTPDGEDLRVVADMCRHLDGLPLAIELAAARLHTLTLGEVAAGLQTRFRVLTGGRRTTARHRSLAAAVSWSYDLLSEQEQAMFDALSVFQSPFPAAGPAAVLDAEPGVAADLLSALVERSLVHRVGARYGALESIRQFGAERLAERGVTAAMRERHARYHERYVADAHDRLRRAGHTDVLEDLDASLGDLRTAQRWLAEHGSHHERLRYCVGLRDYGFYRMRPEVLGWAEEAARAAEASGYLDPLVGEAYAVASLEAWKRGDLQRGVDLITDASRAMHECGQVTYYVLENLGHHNLIRGRLEEALGWHEAALATDTARDDELCRLESQGSRVLALGYSEDPRTAAAVEAMIAGVDEGTPELGAAWAWYAAGEVAVQRDPAQAAAHLRRAVEVADSCGASFMTVIAGASAASIEGRSGDPRRAVQDYRWLLAAGQRAGVHVLQWTMLRAVAELLVRVHEHAAAGSLLGAITSTASGHEVFGADAERLAVVRGAVVDALGALEAEQRIAAGAQLDDDDAVAIALDAFDRLEHHAPSRV